MPKLEEIHVRTWHKGSTHAIKALPSDDRNRPELEESEFRRLVEKEKLKERRMCGDIQGSILYSRNQYTELFSQRFFWYSSCVLGLGGGREGAFPARGRCA